MNTGASHPALSAERIVQSPIDIAGTAGARASEQSASAILTIAKNVTECLIFVKFTMREMVAWRASPESRKRS
jgi:hypothetical protein